LAKYFLNEFGVVCLDGSLFYSEQEYSVRFSIVKEESVKGVAKIVEKLLYKDESNTPK